MSKAKGFTLVELMIAIVVLGIIASIATPAMSQFVFRQKVNSQANELMLSFAFARSEAVKRNANIVVIPATNSSTGWSDGWCIGTSNITNCSHADVLRSFPGNDDVSITTAYLASGASRLMFQRDGTVCLACSDIPITITSPKLEATGKDARCIKINRQGRSVVSKITRDASC